MSLFTLEIRTDYGMTITRCVFEASDVLNLALHCKPESLADEMRRLAYMTPLDADEVEQACLWAEYGDQRALRETVGVASLAEIAAGNVLGITREQRRQLLGLPAYEVA